MPETSILNLSDDALITRGIIKISDVVPVAFWISSVLGHVFFLGTCVLSWWLRNPWVFLMAGGATLALAAVQVATVRILFLLNRNQLELRILATDLPREAASMVAAHMSPPGLR
jgi:hypothetical protein